jgi:hypothetical protein
MEYLGPDREAIGREKAAIMRPGKPAVFSDPVPPASVAAYAKEIGADLLRAHTALLPLARTPRITGFRAPGYNTSGALLEAVADLGYEYDSSLLPSPIYFALRAAAIGAYAVLRRPSRSLRGSLRAFAGPQAPYPVAPERPWRPHPGGRLLEIPITCEPVTRAPLIGTTWVVAGERLRRRMLMSVLERLSIVNFEMHAIDLLDASDPGVPPDLGRAQRDLGIPVKRKMRAFRELFRMLSEEREIATLGAIAERARASASGSRQSRRDR